MPKRKAEPKHITQNKRIATVTRVGVQGAPLATRGFSANYGSSPGEKKVSDKPSWIDASNPTVTERDQLIFKVNTDGAFTLLHAPKIGTDFTSRVGRKTCAKSIYIRGVIAIRRAITEASASAFHSSAQQVRCIVFVDWQPNGAPATTGQLLKFTTTAAPTQQLNLNNRDRFHIIKDKVWYFDPLPASAGSLNRTGASVKIYKKINIETTFNGNNSTGDAPTDSQGGIGDITTGAIYMMWIGQHSPDGTNNTECEFRGTTRIRFDDL